MLSMILAITIVLAGSTVVALPLGIACAIGIVMALPGNIRTIGRRAVQGISTIPTVVLGIGLMRILPHAASESSRITTIMVLVVGLPMFIVSAVVFCDILTSKTRWENRRTLRPIITAGAMIAGIIALYSLSHRIGSLPLPAVRSAMVLSLLIGFMAIPTVVHVSAESLSGAVRRFRSASYALGATRSESLAHIIIPASRLGIMGSLLLGTTRALTEIMALHMSDLAAYNHRRPVDTGEYLEFMLESVLRIVRHFTGGETAICRYSDIPAILIIIATTVLGYFAARFVKSQAVRSMAGHASDSM